MSRIFHPLLYMLACATRQELAAQLHYLKVENEVLREKLPKRITVTPEERRRLVKAGRKLGSAIKELVTIVTSRTFARWVNAENEKKPKPRKKPGRPRTPEDIRQLVIRIAQETGWGYTKPYPYCPPLRSESRDFAVEFLVLLTLLRFVDRPRFGSCQLGRVCGVAF